MRYLFLMLSISLLFTDIAQANNCEQHPIYCKIKKLQPNINKVRAMEISNYIHEFTKTNDIDPMISLAILNQENRFRDVHTYEIEYFTNPILNCHSCIKPTARLHYKIMDMGIAQINVQTAADYGFDLQRLYNHDLRYAISCHIAILKDKIKMCKKLGDYAWSCYHSKTPKHRLKYVELVSRYR